MLRNLFVMTVSIFFLLGCNSKTFNSRTSIGSSELKTKSAMKAEIFRTALTSDVATLPTDNRYHVDDYYNAEEDTGDYTKAAGIAVKLAMKTSGTVVFKSRKTYKIRYLFLSPSWKEAGETMPGGIEGNNATLIPYEGADSTLVFLENPHSGTTETYNYNFFMKDLIIDGENSVDHGFYMHGGQHFNISNIIVKNANSNGFVVHGEPGYGVYYGEFSHIHARDNGGHGIEFRSLVTGNYIANVKLDSCISMFNEGRGYNIEFASLTLNAVSAEKNNGVGIGVSHVYSFDLIGGYFEHNGEGYAVDNAPDAGTEDVAIQIIDWGTGIYILGGRIIGRIIYPANTRGSIHSRGHPRYDSSVTLPQNADTKTIPNLPTPDITDPSLPEKPVPDVTGIGTNDGEDPDPDPENPKVYAKWDSLGLNPSIALSNNDLTATSETEGQWRSHRSDVGVTSGKWYWEVKLDPLAAQKYLFIGVKNASESDYSLLGATADGISISCRNGYIYSAGSTQTNIWASNTGDVFGIALDMDNNKITFYRNGVSVGPAQTVPTGELFPALGYYNRGSFATANFGDSPMTYVAPDGFNSGLW